jgi:putative ABC transport system substrate-binding protein
LKTGVVLSLSKDGRVRRRDFIKAFTASAAAWPLAARAQQSAMPVIAFLRSTSAAGSEHLVAAFEQGLKEAGFIMGQNIAIDYRWGNDQTDRLPGLVETVTRYDQLPLGPGRR